MKPWSRTPYRWVRVQSPGRDGLWAAVGREGCDAPALEPRAAPGQNGCAYS
ncbi:hypothetical protein [Bradyrhizobium vignae]|uniref:hypothetical protein n=1 Tax=Bradyrhizobium vignae TaxID=1549949 RepID=UPI003D3205CD